MGNDNKGGSPAFISVIWRHRWIVVGVTAVVVASAAFMSSRQERAYVATADVLVATEPDAAPGEVPNMETEKRLASSPAVADGVREELRLATTSTSLLRGLSIGVPVDTEILQMSYEDAIPERAQRLAQEFATQYLAFRAAQIQGRAQASIDALEDRLEDLERRSSVAARRSARTESLARQNAINAQITAFTADILEVEGQIGLARERLNVVPGEIVAPANLPASPSRPDPVTDIGLGLLAGLALGIGAAFARELLDDRVRSRDEVERLFPARVIGTIPPMQLRQHPTNVLVTATDPRAPAADAFRQLRADLELVLVPGDAKSIVVTSSEEEEGKTITAANLAVAFARAGRTVVLISGDLRAPGLERFFDLPVVPGFADVLAGRAGVLDAIRDTAIENLRVLPAGHPTDHPADVLTSETVATAITDAEAVADIVIVDAPPLLPVPDARLLMGATDAVLLAVDFRSTQRRDLAKIAQRLDRSGAMVAGIVILNDSAAWRGAYPTVRRRRMISLSYDQLTSNGASAPARAVPTMRNVSTRDVDPTRPHQQGDQ